MDSYSRNITSWVNLTTRQQKYLSFEGFLFNNKKLTNLTSHPVKAKNQLCRNYFQNIFRQNEFHTWNHYGSYQIYPTIFRDDQFLPTFPILKNFQKVFLPLYLSFQLSKQVTSNSDFVRMSNRSRREILLRRAIENGLPHLSVRHAEHVNELNGARAIWLIGPCQSSTLSILPKIFLGRNLKIVLQVTCLVYSNPGL